MFLMSEEPLYSQLSPSVRVSAPATEREISSLTTYWSESTSSSRRFGGPASRHGILKSIFQLALYLPS